jgi:hypothetical protein
MLVLAVLALGLVTLRLARAQPSAPSEPEAKPTAGGEPPPSSGGDEPPPSGESGGGTEPLSF